MPIPKLTPKLFAHIHSDHRLIASHLQGNTYESSINYINYMLNLIAKQEQGVVTNQQRQELIKQFAALVHFEQQISKAQECLSNANKIFSTEEIKYYIHPITQSIMNELKHSGDVLFPGGWVATAHGAGSGHAMIYQFQLQADGSYLFIIYNTGAGLEYHDKESHLKDKYVPLKVYRVKNMAALAPMITELLMPRIAPLLPSMWKKKIDANGTIREEIDTEWVDRALYDSMRVYEEVIGSFVSKPWVTTENSSKFTSIRTKGQISGTCTMRCLMPLLRAKLGQEHYKIFSYKQELQSIQDYFNQEQAVLENPKHKDLPMIRRLLTHAIERLANRINHMEQRGELGHEAAEQSLEKLSDIRQKLDAYPIDQNGISRPSTTLLELNSSLTPPEAEPLDAIPEGKSITLKKTLAEVPKQHECSEPYTFLKKVHETCVFNHQEGHHEALKMQLETLLLDIDLDKLDYWNHLSEEKARNALAYLHDVLRLYGACCKQLHAHISGRQAITANTLLLLSYRVSLRCFSDPKAFEPHMTRILFNKPPLQGIDTISLDPDLDKRFKKLNDIHHELYKKHSKTLDPDKKWNPHDDFVQTYWAHEMTPAEQKQLSTPNVNEASGLDRKLLNFYENLGVMNESSYWEPNTLYQICTYRIAQGKWANDQRDRHRQKTSVFTQLEQIQCESSSLQRGYYADFPYKFPYALTEYLQDSQAGVHVLWNKQILNRIMLSIGSEHQAFKEIFNDTQEYDTKTQYCVHSITIRGNRGTSPFALSDPLHTLLFKLNHDDWKKDPAFHDPTDEEGLTKPFLSYKINNEDLILRAELENQSGKALYRELLSLHANPDIMPIATKDFFQLHIDLLQYEDYQKIALVNFFSPGVLEKQLQRTSEFSLDVVSFIDKIYTYHKHAQAVTTGIVFSFKFAYFLLKYLKKQEPQTPKIAQAIQQIEQFNQRLMLHVPQEMPKDISQETIQQYSQLRSIHFLMHSLTEQSYLDEHELEDLIRNLLYPLPEDPILSNEMIDAKQKMISLIKLSLNQLDGSTQETLIKNVFAQLPETIRPHIGENTEISIKYPYVQLTLKEEQIIIDLALGEMLSSKGHWIVIPHELLQSEQLKRLIGSNPMNVYQRVSGEYAIHEMNHNGIAYRILLHQKTRAIRIQRKIPNESKWFELIDSKKAPQLSSRYEDLDCLWWCETDSNERTPSYYCYRDQPGMNEQLLLSAKSDGAGNLVCFYSESNKGGKEIHYTLVSSNQKNNQLIYKIFTPFEALRHIEVWRTTEAPDELNIKLPRYGLEWKAREITVNGTRQLEFFWSDHEDFKLLFDQPNVIEGFSHALQMYNEKTGETIALLPKQAFYAPPNIPPDGEYAHLEYDRDNEIPKTILEKHLKRASAPWISLKSQQYRQMRVQNKRLVGDTPVDCLHIAHLALTKHDADQAMAALRRCKELGGLKGTEEEMSLMMQIIVDTPVKEYGFGEATAEPETLAVRAYAAVLLREQQAKSFNTLLFSPDNHPNPKTGNEIYAQYHTNKVAQFYHEFSKTRLNKKTGMYEQSELEKLYSHMHQVRNDIPAAMHLSTTESLTLLRTINPSYGPLSNALRFYERKHAEEERKHLVKKQAQVTLNAAQIQRLNELDQQIENLQGVKLRKEQGKTAKIPKHDTAPKPITLLELSAPESKTNATLERFLIAYQRHQHAMATATKSSSKKQNKLKREREAAKRKTKAIQNSDAFYTKQLNSEDVQKDLEQHFSTLIEAAAPRFKEQEHYLPRLANTQIVIQKAAVQSRQLIQLTLPDLICLYVTGDMELYKEKTLLDEASIIQLHAQVHQYLIENTANQRNQHVLTLLHKINQLKIERKQQTQDYIESLSALGRILSAPAHHFDPKDHRELLVFEFLEQASFRKEQVESIQTLLQSEGDGFNNEVVQLKMGAGKSKFLLPSLAVIKACGTNLSVVVFPVSLFETGRADLIKKTQECFGKVGFSLIFDRQKNTSAAALQALFERLRDTQMNREYVITTPDSIQSLQLKYLELLNKERLTAEEQKQVDQLKRILYLFKERADVLIDECDTVLDSKKDLNYTLGSSNLVPNERVTMILSMYRSLERCVLTINNKQITLKDVLLREVALSTEKDWDRAMETLAKTLLKDPDGLLTFIPQKKYAEVFDYLLSHSTAIPTYIAEELSKEQQNTVGLIKGELELFKITLKKKPNASYGFPRSKEFHGSKHIAIPYKANNEPDERAQFASVYETLNYTIQLHKREKKLPKDRVDAFINDFQTNATKEFLENPHLDLKETKAAQEFFKIVGEPLQLQASKKYSARINDVLNTTETAFDYVLHHYILNQVTQHSKILGSNAINLIGQFRSAQGFTGTPWNAHCYHSKLHFNEEKHVGIDGETINLLVDKQCAVSFFESISPEEIIKHVMQTQEHPEKIRAFLDIGALFEGKSNLEMALLFAVHLKQSKEIKQILFFNEDHVLCSLDMSKIPADTLDAKAMEQAIIVIASTDPKIIQQKTGVSPKERFTYYDQSHTTGIDILQAEDAVGIATLDLDTKARDCWQGVMRLMRKEPSKQKVNFILPNRILNKEIKGTKKTDPKAWSVEDVIFMVQENQEKALDDLHLHAALNKMTHIARQYFLDQCMLRNTPEEQSHLVKACEDFFITTLLQEPYQQFGGMEQVLSTQEILETHKAQCLKKVRALLEAKVEMTTLEKELSCVAEEAKAYCAPKYVWQSMKQATRILLFFTKLLCYIGRYCC